MSNPYLGEIRIVPFNFAPSGWALCQGQLLPITQNEPLFNLIGTYYGGDGRTTFALPDLRGRVVMGAGQGASLSNRVFASAAGVETVVLDQNQMPAHNHTIVCSAAGGTQASPAGGFPAVESTGTSLNYAASGASLMNGAVVGSAGGTIPVPVLPPYLTLNFIIALSGIFPSQS